MSGTNKRKEAKINSMIADLESGNELKMSAAVKALQANGDASVLPHVVELLRTDLNDKMRTELSEFLNDLKDSSAIPAMMELLLKEDDAEIRKILLTAIWSGKLDYSRYLSDFVALAVDGDFMEAVDCITVIENLEGPFEEQQILESQLYLKEFLEDDAPKDPQKSHIMSEIALLIKEMNELEDDGLEEYL